MTSRLTSGADDLDRRLAGGFLAAAVHEIHAEDHINVASGFGFLLALRAAASRPIVVIRDERCIDAAGRLYGDGIAALGGDPSQVIVIHAANTLAVLRAGAEAVACPASGAVVIELSGAAVEYNLTASRRLALAAARTGVFTLVVRACANPPPSAATTRWRVRGAPSTALAANAPGGPAFDLSLLRHRGGIAGYETRVEWNCDLQRFDDAALSRGVPAVAVGGTRDSRQSRAA